MSAPDEHRGAGWIVRPIVWFTTGSIVTTIPHELAHVSAVFALGVRSTLYNYSGRLDLNPVQAASNLPALIRVAGPLFCLGVGLVGWLAFKRVRDPALELPLLYFAVFGVGTFFGNLMSTASVGDFSTVAAALGLPMAARAAIAVASALCVATLHFWMGRALVDRTPARIGRVTGTLGIVVAPVVLGTAAVILVNQPMPAASVIARVIESGFWLFAALGALTASKDRDVPRQRLAPRWGDGVVALLAILLVRLMVRGIPFDP